MDRAALTRTVEGLWDDAVLPSLSELVAVPAVSPGFDPQWRENGQLDAAVDLMRRWIASRGLPGATLEVIQLADRSPLLMVDIPGTDGADAGTVLLYGHLDKQPPMDGWDEGLGPWTPVIRDDRLYGRGSVDDGYAGFAAVAALEALRVNGGAYSRCVLLLETGEESGSPDLPAYLELLSERLGRVSLVVCLDSGAGDYERMWLTTSLRGLVQIQVTARVLDVGQHSGSASGVVPSSFRVLRILLDRIEDAATGEITLPELAVEVPADRMAEIEATVEVMRGTLDAAFPMTDGVRMVSDDELELTLNRTWRATLSVTGAEGLPAPADAGNVLRPSTGLCLSFRLPPTADSQKALAAIERTLTSDAPYNARIELSRREAANGWNAPTLAPWLRDALDAASEDVFGEPWRTLGEGGSIPFMGLLSEAYPDAQFVVTGALGPGSNAHVPNESLHLDYVKKVTAGVALILDAHSRS
ncbi:peptidase M20 [Longimycelium tulufanense]|uniref:Peptidase M20 n=1 Tax=Longimycelium tulufanense TaxID=907463 RepID=A0A8J3C905_9PSEU|nr:peptidase M20 [Longimycelium tulufanense]